MFADAIVLASLVIKRIIVAVCIWFMIVEKWVNVVDPCSNDSKCTKKNKKIVKIIDKPIVLKYTKIV